MKTEHEWMKQGDPHSPTLPWMPFQPADFLAIMFDAVAEVTGRKFLDVGCGPGTKMMLASHFYGMRADGIEIDAPMADAAARYGPVMNMSALDVPKGYYSEFDVIWLYRPFRDPALEAALEERILAEMKPGSVLAGGAWETDMPGSGLVTVVDDWEVRRGAWMKRG